MLITHSLQTRCCSELRSVFVIEFNDQQFGLTYQLFGLFMVYWHLLSKVYRRINHKVKAISALDINKLRLNVTYPPIKIQPVCKIARTFRVRRDHCRFIYLCLLVRLATREPTACVADRLLPRSLFAKPSQDDYCYIQKFMFDSLVCINEDLDIKSIIIFIIYSK